MEDGTNHFGFSAFLGIGAMIWFALSLGIQNFYDDNRDRGRHCIRWLDHGKRPVIFFINKFLSGRIRKGKLFL
jgi:hypothetical protein